MSERRYKHPQVNLRLPDELKNRVVELAEANGRSANAEMVAAIEYWVNKHKNIQPLDLVALSQRLAILEKEVDLLKKENDSES